MPYVLFVNDETIKKLVKDILDIGRKSKSNALKNFEKNVIDPFSALFESAISETSHETWKNAEMARQYQKTLVNSIGNLHQKILGSVEGWEDLSRGNMVDLVCKEKK